MNSAQNDPSPASGENAKRQDSQAPNAAAGEAPAGNQAYLRRAAGTSARFLADAAHLGAPALKRWSAGFGNWLVSIGWVKFFLLSVLLLILASVTFSFLISSGATDASSWPAKGSIDVLVHVVPLPDGTMQISPADGRADAAGKTRAKSKAHLQKSDDSVLLQIDGDGDEKNPSVRIDKEGVRILADDEGGKASVIIDHNGVRIEKLAPKDIAHAKAGGANSAGADGSPNGESMSAAPSVAAPGSRVVRVRPDVVDDPEKVAEAVEAARDQIETILQEQVDDRLEAVQVGDRTERENWLELLTIMTIIALIILKVVLGSKSKAEFQARQASTTAAQEGLKRQLAEAQLKMMQAQVEPHFLFNTLASVDYLIETDAPRASRMQKNLIQYLRAALPQMREATSTLGREVVQCRSYLEILKVRMDERLQFSINVPQGLLTASFPPMMLLTLVENAIKHGLEPKSEGGTLSVGAIVSDGKLRVSVADSGMGFGVAQRGGTGVGLTNVRERLQALYGTEASLSIDANSDGGTIATILVPYRIDAKGAAAAASDAALAAGASPAPAV